MKIGALLLVIMFSFTCKADEQLKKVNLFASNIISLVASGDSTKFRQLSCYPENCTDSTYRENLIFNEKGITTKYEEILGNPDIKIKVFGPYTYDQALPNLSYLIVFYTPNNSPFNTQGEIPMDLGFKEFGVSFLETVVTIYKGRVSFHRTPFYIESHHPYVGEYG